MSLTVDVNNDILCINRDDFYFGLDIGLPLKMLMSVFAGMTWGKATYGAAEKKPAAGGPARWWKRERSSS
ncbi:MAG: hypothetical protein Q9228_001831 [Teloschistes exilis]